MPFDLVRVGIRVEQEVLDGLAGLAGDDSKGLDRGLDAAVLDQMDGGTADLTGRDLGEAETCFEPGLPDGAFADGDSSTTPLITAVEHGGNHTATLDTAETNLTD